MANLYNVLLALCEERGITGYRMCKDLGIQPSVMTDLKMGRRSSVKAETAERIASYFGVTISYLLGVDQNEKSPVYDGEALELMDAMHKRPELKVLFSTTKGAKKADIEFVNEMLKRMAGESDYDTD